MSCEWKKESKKYSISGMIICYNTLEAHNDENGHMHIGYLYTFSVDRDAHTTDDTTTYLESVLQSKTMKVENELKIDRNKRKSRGRKKNKIVQTKTNHYSSESEKTQQPTKWIMWNNAYQSE